MKYRPLLAMLALVAIAPSLMSFCGFYVSKADGTLKNKTSQVIMVRDGLKNVITMYNDFEGDTRDFAMVVPVPVVLNESDIKVISPDIFNRLNDYSAPRLVEYYDENPCAPPILYERLQTMDGASQPRSTNVKKENSVQIEAKYLVGEYDILILSAKESNGLKSWLNENGYKIPENAEEVLDPYIKSNLKFFVAKVNETEKKKLNKQFLSPIQIHFESPKFMLPIRLGMANADGDQDLVVYAFTKKGRIECTNYRNSEIATDRNIPLFVQKNFSAFYQNLFTTQWQRENKSVAFVEYAWDVTPINPMKCDPCVGNPPSISDMVMSGVWWANGRDWNDYSEEALNNTEPGGEIFFTRLHFRYNRASFPQDLSFQVTGNKENFQARYIITHPAEGKLNCAEGKAYLNRLRERRIAELNELKNLTGKDQQTWQETALQNMDEELPADSILQYGELARQTDRKGKSPLPIVLTLLGCAAIIGVVSRKGPGTKI